MKLRFKTEIAFQKRTGSVQGEIVLVRDGRGRIVETWECVGAAPGYVEFHAEGYRDVSSL